MPRRLHDTPLLIATFATLLLVACAAHAENPPGEDDAIAAEVAQVLPHVSPSAAGAPVAPPQSFWLERFVDHFDMGRRLRSIHSLKLVSLWDSRHVSVFVGVNRRGMPGLHIQQQDPAYVARLEVSKTMPDVLPPLRAVPLSSP